MSDSAWEFLKVSAGCLLCYTHVFDRSIRLRLKPYYMLYHQLDVSLSAGFIEFIVEPSMSVCGELLEKVAAYLHGAEAGGAANGLDRKTGQ